MCDIQKRPHTTRGESSTWRHHTPPSGGETCKSLVWMEGPSSATHRKPLNFHMIPMKFHMISSWRRLVSLPWDGSDLWLDRAGHGYRDKNHRKPLRRSECLHDGASWLACFHHFDPCLASIAISGSNLALSRGIQPEHYLTVTVRCRTCFVVFVI